MFLNGSTVHFSGNILTHLQTSYGLAFTFIVLLSILRTLAVMLFSWPQHRSTEIETQRWCRDWGNTMNQYRAVTLPTPAALRIAAPSTILSLPSLHLGAAMFSLPYFSALAQCHSQQRRDKETKKFCFYLNRLSLLWGKSGNLKHSITFFFSPLLQYSPDLPFGVSKNSCSKILCNSNQTDAINFHNLVVHLDPFRKKHKYINKLRSSWNIFN